MRVATWNIAGGCKLQSKQLFDYQQEDLGYFAEQLQRIDADVICLQESHTNADRSLARELAETLGGYHVFDSPMSPSHINPDYRLSMAMLAKESFEHTNLYTYPDPPFPMYFSDGRAAVRHAKGLQIARYKGEVITNTHWLPMLTFGRSYASGVGRKFADELAAVMLAHIPASSIVCGDFNVGEYEFDNALTPLIEALHLQNALPDLSTYYLAGVLRPDTTNAPDRIYISSTSHAARGADVIQTETDHYLCWADIERRSL
jgi:endonuclease/exonuclease/phosphatase family metal-dependent hydrolase